MPDPVVANPSRLAKPPAEIPWSPAKFLVGTAGMGAADGWVYTVILNMIYERGGPIACDFERIGRQAGVKPSRVAAAVESLIGQGKLTAQNGPDSDASRTNSVATRTNSDLSRTLYNATAGRILDELGRKSPKKASENKDPKTPSRRGAHEGADSILAKESPAGSHHLHPSDKDVNLEEVKAEVKARVLPRVLAADWQPSSRGRRRWRELLYSAAETDAALERFRWYYREGNGKGKKRDDWDALFARWADGEREKYPPAALVAAADAADRGEAAPPPAAEEPVNEVERIRKAHREWMADWLRIGGWPNIRGERPDRPGCPISDEIMAEFGYVPPHRKEQP